MANDIYIPNELLGTFQSLPEDQRLKVVKTIDSLGENAIENSEAVSADESGSGGLRQAGAGDQRILFRYTPESRSIIIAGVVSKPRLETNRPDAFFSRMMAGLLRIFAMALFGGVHWMLQKALQFEVLPYAPALVVWLEDISFAFFVFVYVYLMWDFLNVFIPWIHPNQYLAAEAKDNEEGGQRKQL